MDTGRFLKWFGLLFVLLGAMIGTGLLIGAIASKTWFLLVMAIAFYGMFCGIGGFFAWCGISMMRGKWNGGIPSEEEENQPEPEIAPEDNDDSAAAVFCPSCGAVVRVPRGESVNCPSCGKRVKAPAR